METARYVQKITALFGKLLASTEIDSEAEELGLTPSQIHGLEYLAHHGRGSLGDMAQGLGTTHPAAVKLVDKLQKKKLVTRTESLVDRRISLVELTEEGRTLADRVVASRTRKLSLALAKLDETELRDLMRGVESLLAAALDDKADLESVCLKCGDEHIGCCIVNRTHLELTGNLIERT